MKVVEESVQRPRNERTKVRKICEGNCDTYNLNGLRSLLDRPGRYARLTVEYISLADLLENNSTPPNSFLDSNCRDAAFFFRFLSSHKAGRPHSLQEPRCRLYPLQRRR